MMEPSSLRWLRFCLELTDIPGALGYYWQNDLMGLVSEIRVENEASQTC